MVAGTVRGHLFVLVRCTLSRVCRYITIIVEDGAADHAAASGCSGTETIGGTAFCAWVLKHNLSTSQTLHSVSPASSPVVSPSRDDNCCVEEVHRLRQLEQVLPISDVWGEPESEEKLDHELVDCHCPLDPVTVQSASGVAGAAARLWPIEMLTGLPGARVYAAVQHNAPHKSVYVVVTSRGEQLPPWTVASDGLPIVWVNPEDCSESIFRHRRSSDCVPPHEAWMSVEDLDWAWGALGSPELAGVSKGHTNVQCVTIGVRAEGGLVLRIGVLAKGYIPNGEGPFPSSVVLMGRRLPVCVCPGYVKWTGGDRLAPVDVLPAGCAIGCEGLDGFRTLGGFLAEGVGVTAGHEWAQGMRVTQSTAGAMPGCHGPEVCY